jgi:predicted secreted protein
MGISFVTSLVVTSLVSSDAGRCNEWNKGNAQLRDISKSAFGRMAEVIENSSISLDFPRVAYAEAG